MGRYRFLVEYRGEAFSGWQEQPGQATVQSTLEDALRICLRRETRVVGAGRTDSGVHASGQVVHFDAEDGLDARRVEHSLNALTPETVCVRKLQACPDDFHARFAALSRLYRYRIALRPTALHAHLSWHPGFPLSVARLADELRSVVGRHDFVNFCVPREDGKSTDCHLLRADAAIVPMAGGTPAAGRSGAGSPGVEDGDGFLVITVEGDRFLHKMVRSIVGAAFDVARGAHAPGLSAAILAGTFKGERTWAPAKGLCLEQVKYADGYG